MHALLSISIAAQVFVGITGQSNANGQGAPALSTSNVGGGKRFDDSLYALNPSPWPLTALIMEPTCTGSTASQALCGAPTAESPWTAFDRALNSITGRKMQYGSCAQGGIALASLPVTYCTNQLARWGAATPNVDGCVLVMVHGEADDSINTPGSTYSAGLVTLQNLWQASCRNTTAVGKLYQAPLFQMQYSAWTGYESSATPNGIPNAQRTAARDSPNIFLAGPGYRLTYGGGTVHYDNVSARALGWYLGQAVATWYTTGAFRPLEPTVITRNGTAVFVTYRVPCVAMGTCSDATHPIGFNTTDITAQTNQGFEYVGANITQVVLCTGPNTPISGCPSSSAVAINLDSAVGGTLRYAFTGTANNLPGRVTGARGNVCDNSTRLVPEDSTKLINCGVTFTEVVP